MKYTKQQLNNGLRVLLIERPDMRTVSVFLLVKVGSRYEHPEQKGISHFLEHLLLKGTETRRTKLEIAKQLDSVGAQYNAFTGKDNTGYFIKVAYNQLDLALNHIADIIQNSLLRPSDIAREKNVIIEELKTYEDNPNFYIHYLYEALMFGSNPLAWEIGGLRKTVRNINKTKLKQHLEQYYTGSQMVLAVAGNFKTVATTKKIKQCFGKIKGTKIEHHPNDRNFGFKPCGHKQTKPRLKVQNRALGQLQVMMGWPALALSDPRIDALNLLSIILGGNSSSRLFTQVRGKLGFCYSIYCSMSSYQDVGSIYIRSGLDKKNLNRAIQAITNEIKRIKQKGVTVAELQRAKDFITGQLSISLENSSIYASHYAEQELLMNKVQTFDDELQELIAIKPKAIKDIANEIFVKDKINLTIIGDVKEDKVRNIIDKVDL